MRVAVLDLGSNSFRLQLSEVGPDESITGIHQERRMLHLGGVVALHGHLPAPEATLAVTTARDLADVAERVGCDRLFAVGTSALRQAANGAEIVDRIGQVIGTTVKIVDGIEEARLAFLGAQTAVRLPAGDRLVLDLGGGSLELALGEGTDLRWSTTHLLGVSHLHAVVGGGEVLKKKHLRAIEEAVTSDLSGIEPVSAPAVAVGGSVRALGDLIAVGRSAWVPDSVNHVRVTVDEVADLTSRMAPLTAAERIDRLDVSASRAVDLPVAGAVLASTMRRLGLESVVVSDWGLRTGVLVDALGLSLPTGEEVWRRSAEGLRRRFLPEDDHPTHVARLVEQLWPQLAPHHRLPDSDRRVVVAAALLHDIGKSLALTGHHRHSAYLVEHAGLRGLDPEELAAVLSLVRYHRGGAPKRRYAPFGSLDRGHQARVGRMGAVLQLADALDRGRDGAVEQVVVGDDGSSLLLRLIGESGPRPPEPGPSEARLSYVAETFGRRLEFVVASVDTLGPVRSHP